MKNSAAEGNSIILFSGRGKANAALRCGIAAFSLVIASSTSAALLAQSTSNAVSGDVAAAEYPGGKWNPGPKKFGVLTVENVPVAADDGTVLNAVVYYPADLQTGQRAAGNFPVVVEHTIYQSRPTNPRMRFLVERGYIYTVVSARGAWKSGGELQAFTSRDARDGQSIIDWAAHRLPGSDGRIALSGCSWPSVMALGNAAFAGPNSPVKAVVASCAGLDAVQHQSWLVGGATNASFWTLTSGAAGAAGNTPAAKTFFDATIKDIIAGGPAAYDGKFWADRSPIGWAKKIADNGIPVLLWAGWRDISEQSVMRTYTALQNATRNRPLEAPMVPGQRTTPKYQVILGDWTHGGGLDSGVHLEWFDTWLKGVDTGLQSTSTTMHLFEKGTKRWVNASGYPVVARATRWSLQSGGALKQGGSAAGSNRLVFGAPTEAAGKLTFQTSPLTAGTTIAGPMSATVYAKSSNTNMMLIAKLYDLAPDGSKEAVSGGVLVGSQKELDLPASWRDSSGAMVWPWPRLDKDVYLTPGKIYRFDIAMAPRQWGIAPGHRLQFELSTQSPVEICPAAPELPKRGSSDQCGLTAPQRKTIPGGAYQIYYGPKWPSALNLPQLPAKAMAEVRAARMPPPEGDPVPGRPPEEIVLPMDWGSGK